MNERAHETGRAESPAETGPIAARATLLEVRPLAGGDLDQVVALHAEVFRIQSSRRFLARAYYPTFLVAASTGFGFVARFDGAHGATFAGFFVGALDDAAFHRALVRRHPLECALAFLAKRGTGSGTSVARLARGEARFHYIAVAPAGRGRGAGRRLLETALAHARAAGAAACSSRIYDGSEASRRLNEELGARRVGEGVDALGRFGVYRFELGSNAGERAPNGG